MGVHLLDQIRRHQRADCCLFDRRPIDTLQPHDLVAQIDVCRKVLDQTINPRKTLTECFPHCVLENLWGCATRLDPFARQILDERKGAMIGTEHDERVRQPDSAVDFLKELFQNRVEPQ